MRISDWSSDVCSSDLQYRTAKQKLLNQEMAKINPDLIHKIGDFAQTIIPLATASMTSKAVEELNGQPVWSRIKAVFAEGHTKGELRQALIDAPMDKKMEVAQELAGIIQDTQSIENGRASCRKRV